MGGMYIPASFKVDDPARIEAFMDRFPFATLVGPGLGPHAYVSPTWYATSPAVPTWNYSAVHAHGAPRATDDPTFTREVLRELVARHERGPGAWTPDALPAEMAESLVAAIVAFELPVTRLEVKFKLGQNRSAADRAGTIAGLEQDGTPQGLELAKFMREHAGTP
jgi:transcriptional regulator